MYAAGFSVLVRGSPFNALAIFTGYSFRKVTLRLVRYALNSFPSAVGFIILVFPFVRRIFSIWNPHYACPHSFNVTHYPLFLLQTAPQDRVFAMVCTHPVSPVSIVDNGQDQYIFLDNVCLYLRS